MSNYSQPSKVDGVPDNIQLTPEEENVLRECKTNSLYYKGLPMGVISVVTANLLMKYGKFPFLSKRPRLTQSVFFTFGFSAGLTAGAQECYTKIMKLENSKLKDSLFNRNSSQRHSSSEFSNDENGREEELHAERSPDIATSYSNEAQGHQQSIKKLTMEELKILRDCRVNMIFFNVLPLGVLSFVVAKGLVKKGISPFVKSPQMFQSVFGFCGVMTGLITGSSQCSKKILTLGDDSELKRLTLKRMGRQLPSTEFSVDNRVLHEDSKEGTLGDSLGRRNNEPTSRWQNVNQQLHEQSGFSNYGDENKENKQSDEEESLLRKRKPSRWEEIRQQNEKNTLSNQNWRSSHNNQNKSGSNDDDRKTTSDKHSPNRYNTRTSRDMISNHEGKSDRFSSSSNSKKRNEYGDEME